MILSDSSDMSLAGIDGGPLAQLGPSAPEAGLLSWLPGPQVLKEIQASFEQEVAEFQVPAEAHQEAWYPVRGPAVYKSWNMAYGCKTAKISRACRMQPRDHATDKV